MQTARTNTLDLSVGSMFLVDNERHGSAQIEVLSRKGEDVEVRISFPARPSECDRCHHDLGLSMNGVTGVMVCMTTGCGKDFGYEPWKTQVMRVSDFVRV